MGKATFGIIGTGAIVGMHAQALSDLDTAELRAVYESARTGLAVRNGGVRAPANPF